MPEDQPKDPYQSGMSDYPTPRASDALAAARANAPYQPTSPLQAIPESLKDAHRDRPINAMRTFRSDAQEYLNREKKSAASIIAETSSRRSRTVTGQTEDASSHRNIKLAVFILVSIGLIAAGALALMLSVQLTRPEPPALLSSQPFQADNTARTSLSSSADRSQLFSPLSQITNNGKVGEITRIIPQSAIAGGVEMSTAEFFALLAPGAPASLSRAIGQNFILGKHHILQSEALIIFDVDDFENAFAGILDWEPLMFADIAPLLEAMTGSRNNTEPRDQPRLFRDEVLQNLDARVIRDVSGDINLLYAFYGRDTLIIASHEETLKELIFRMTAFKKAR